MPKRIEVEKDNFYALVSKKEQSEDEMKPEDDESCFYSFPNKELKKPPKSSKQKDAHITDNYEILYSQVDRSKTKNIDKNEENVKSSKPLYTSSLYHKVEPSTTGIASSATLPSNNSIDATLSTNNQPSIISFCSPAGSSNFPLLSSNNLSVYSEITADFYNQLVPHDLYSEIDSELFENEDAPGYECLRSNKTNKITLANSDETDYEAFNDDYVDDSCNYEEIKYEVKAKTEKNDEIISKKTEKNNEYEIGAKNNEAIKKNEEKKNANFMKKTQKELKKLLKKNSNKTEEEPNSVEKSQKSFENLKDAIKEMPSPFENVKKLFEKNSAKTDYCKAFKRSVKKNSKKLERNSMENLRKLSSTTTQSFEDFGSSMNFSTSKTKISYYWNNLKEKDKYDFTIKKKIPPSELFFPMNVPSATFLNYYKQQDSSINHLPLSKPPNANPSRCHPMTNIKINTLTNSLDFHHKASDSTSNITCSSFKTTNGPRYYENPNYYSEQNVDDAIVYNKTFQNKKYFQEFFLNSPIFHHKPKFSQKTEKKTLKQTFSLDTALKPQNVKKTLKSISESSITDKAASGNTGLLAAFGQSVTLDQKVKKTIITNKLHSRPSSATQTHNKPSYLLHPALPETSQNYNTHSDHLHQDCFEINNRDSSSNSDSCYNNCDIGERNIYENFGFLGNPPWFKPHISRDEMVELLKNQAAGAFIIRKSSSYHGEYSLGLKVAQLPFKLAGKTDVQISDFVRHLLIEQLPNGVRVYGSEIEPIFADLSSLVAKHSSDALSLPCKLNLHALHA